jgi:hypothetical protein
MAAAAAIARLDEALHHSLQRAFTDRARLDAIRRQAAADRPLRRDAVTVLYLFPRRRSLSA